MQQVPALEYDGGQSEHLGTVIGLLTVEGREGEGVAAARDCTLVDMKLSDCVSVHFTIGSAGF